METRGSSNTSRWFARHWFVVAAFVLFVIETVAMRSHGGLWFHYRHAWVVDRSALVFQTFLVLLRVFSVSVLVGLCFDGVFCRKPVKLRASLFFLCFSFGLLFVGWRYSSFSSAVPVPALAILGAVIAIGMWLRGPTTNEAIRHLVRGLYFVGLVGLLWTTGRSHWHPFLSPPTQAVSGPSFVLMSLDGLTREDWDGRYPQWEKPPGLFFENAYAVTNSTYTSLYSVLSGRYPRMSGVEDLFPADRNPDPEVLLSERLRKRGYETIWMTDCASTAAMGAAMGFEKRYQAAYGIYGCGRSLLTSLRTWVNLPGIREFFPELQSFCSATYQPDRFFERVQSVIEVRKASKRPFFLMAHSCVTHEEVFQRQNRHGIAAKGVSQLRATTKTHPNTWFFAFSDHGQARTEMGKSHGTGYPLSRYQYHVPLGIQAPAQIEVSAMRSQSLVALFDLYPTILELAGVALEERLAAQSLFSPLSKRPLWLSSASSDPYLTALSYARLGKGGLLSSMTKTASPVRAYLSWPYRLLVSHRVHGLYDELKDPHNQQDLQSQQPEVVDRLKQDIQSSGRLR